MPEIKLTITHEVGLHARPASAFVQTAIKFSSEKQQPMLKASWLC